MKRPQHISPPSAQAMGGGRLRSATYKDQSLITDPVANVAPRNGSDPGPSSGGGWLYKNATTGAQDTQRRRSASSAPHPERSGRTGAAIESSPRTKSSVPRDSAADSNTDIIDRGILSIAELVPRERYGLHTVENPETKIRGIIDVSGLRRRLQDPTSIVLSGKKKKCELIFLRSVT